MNWPLNQTAPHRQPPPPANRDLAGATPFHFGGKWERRWETGIAVIDHQHKRLLDLMNDIRCAIAATDVLECHALLEELLAFIQEHFDLEERLMELGGYSQLEAHRKSHWDLLSRLKAHHDAILQGAEISPEALGGIELLLTSHMAEEDKKFARQIKHKLGDDLFERIWIRVFSIFE